MSLKRISRSVASRVEIIESSTEEQRERERKKGGRERVLPCRYKNVSTILGEIEENRVRRSRCARNLFAKRRRKETRARPGKSLYSGKGS